MAKRRILHVSVEIFIFAYFNSTENSEKCRRICTKAPHQHPKHTFPPLYERNTLKSEILPLRPQKHDDKCDVIKSDLIVIILFWLL